jgi:hypothetical protein
VKTRRRAAKLASCVALALFSLGVFLIGFALFEAGQQGRFAELSKPITGNHGHWDGYHPITDMIERGMMALFIASPVSLVSGVIRPTKASLILGIVGMILSVGIGILYITVLGD